MKRQIYFTPVRLAHYSARINPPGNGAKQAIHKFDFWLDGELNERNGKNDE